MSPVDACKGNWLSPADVGKLEYVDTTRTKPNEVSCLGGAVACEGCPGVYTCAGSANDGLAMTATDIVDCYRLAGLWSCCYCVRALLCAMAFAM